MIFCQRVTVFWFQTQVRKTCEVISLFKLFVGTVGDWIGFNPIRKTLNGV